MLKILLFVTRPIKPCTTKLHKIWVLPADEMMEINKDLQTENYWANNETVDLLDRLSDFFFAKGSFPGS